MAASGCICRRHAWHPECPRHESSGAARAEGLTGNDGDTPGVRVAAPERPLTKFEWQLAKALLEWGRNL